MITFNRRTAALFYDYLQTAQHARRTNRRLRASTKTLAGHVLHFYDNLFWTGAGHKTRRDVGAFMTRRDTCLGSQTPIVRSLGRSRPHAASARQGRVTCHRGSVLEKEVPVIENELYAAN